MSDNNKRQLGIRIPQKLDRSLENYVNKIGISKQAFILNLIYNELDRTERTGKPERKKSARADL